MKAESCILPITKAHLSDIAELELLCFSEPWSEKSLELLLGDMALGVACVQNGRAVAYGGMLLAPGEGQITNVAVHPSYRRCGYGRAVTEALLQSAQERGLEQVALEVRASNQPAIALYQAFGFEVLGTRKRFYRQPTEDALVMVKTMGKETEDSASV